VEKMKELVEIQSALKCKKSQYNSFGKYNYRSAEDILEAVKPLLKEQGCSLVISDDVVIVGNRIYVCAIASIYKESDNEVVCRSAKGWAREAESRKGCDESQLTGLTSSYARKYALNGLFAIDDTKDSDALPPAQTTKPPTQEKPNPPAQTTKPPTQEKPNPPAGKKFTKAQVMTALKAATTKIQLGDKWKKVLESGWGTDAEVKALFDSLSKELP
jgi:hypothetical protein